MFTKLTYKFTKFIFIIIGSLIINFILTTFAYKFLTDKDISNLPPQSKKSMFDDRFLSLYLYNISMYSSLGEAKMYPESNKGKIYTIIYVLISSALLLTVSDVF